MLDNFSQSEIDYAYGVMDEHEGRSPLAHYESASSAGHLEAGHRLGKIYENGECGVQADIEKALEYYRASSAFPQSQERIEIIEKTRAETLQQTSQNYYQMITDDPYLKNMYPYIIQNQMLDKQKETQTSESAAKLASQKITEDTPIPEIDFSSSINRREYINQYKASKNRVRAKELEEGNQEAEHLFKSLSSKKCTTDEDIRKFQRQSAKIAYYAGLDREHDFQGRETSKVASVRHYVQAFELGEPLAGLRLFELGYSLQGNKLPSPIMPTPSFALHRELVNHSKEMDKLTKEIDTLSDWMDRFSKDPVNCPRLRKVVKNS